MSPEVLQYVLAIAACLSALCAVYVAWRAKGWRQSDELKAMIAEAASRWVESAASKALHHRVDDAERRLDVAETTVENLPTKDDLAKIERDVGDVARLLAGQSAALDGVKRTSEASQAGVDRLVAYLLTSTVRG